jgi:cytochrome c-type biogenesis protein CcmH/NrfG
MSDLLIKARALFDQNELVDSLELVNELVSNNKSNCEALILRARIQYRRQNWGAAMNDYYSVLELEPENQEAKSGIEMTKSILGYFTPDMFNP